MPEIAEVARITHFLRVHLVGKKIGKVVTLDDQIVYGKVGTTGSAFEQALKGRTVLSAGSQGKYFWITLDKPPHPVMHFGMTGWIHVKGERTAYTNYYKKQKPEDLELWPPKFWKFHLETTGKEKAEVAFTDPRRLGRIRLVDCPGPEIRKHTPLVENGPDPVVDTDIFTEDFFHSKLRSKRVPIKSLLLDQANISGIGNWVGDEVLYHARVHPEHYSHELNDDQIKALYHAVRDVCQKSCDVLGDSDQFPRDWLFHYRWGKGKSGAGTLPSGEKLAFVTVGGRTSCYCPALQKKGASSQPSPTIASKPKPKGKRQRDELNVKKEDDGEQEALPLQKKKKRRSEAKVDGGLVANGELDEKIDAEDEKPAASKRTVKKEVVATATKKATVKKENAAVKWLVKEEEHVGRRRSVRLSKT